MADAAMQAARRRLTSQGEERKQQLLDRAAELFAERGYADTRIIDICRAAGVAKGLFYWYFENKEALFTEVAGDIRRRLRRYQAEAMDPDADPLLQLRQGTEASVRFMAAHARFFALLEIENTDRNLVGVLRAGTDIHVRDTKRLIEAGRAQGLIRVDDPDLLARGAVSAVAAFSHFHRTGRIQVDLDELARFAGRWVVRSLAVDDREAARVEAAPHFARIVQLR
ncbi:MAG: TetR family transcriptional regulator [Acidimicrobiales bacterium]